MAQKWLVSREVVKAKVAERTKIEEVKAAIIRLDKTVKDMKSKEIGGNKT